jgi:hypothetical protein
MQAHDNIATSPSGEISTEKVQAEMLLGASVIL